MRPSDEPDMIVGIDFGQTCTGVAYTLLKGNDQIRQIQKWPGAQYRNENKVPTVLVYPHNSYEPSFWGFKADDEGTKDDCDAREWFKTLLDPDQFERWRKKDPENTTTYNDVKQWYRHYLTFLYRHVREMLKAELPNFDFESAKIEFLFSMPTTWQPVIVERFRDLICQAGFEGRSNASHVVQMSLTESEAAAVFTFTASSGAFASGDLLVVCDAGGGTTDLSVLETIQATQSTNLEQLRQISPVTGENIGSAAIDDGFEKLILDRLTRADQQQSLGLDLGLTAWLMRKSKDFQNVKCEHGMGYETPQFLIPIPGLSAAYVDGKSRISKGHMQFDKSDLQQVFDEQVHKLFRLIDKQLNAVASEFPGRPVKHLVLSGGLGQSAYVQQRLKSHYSSSNRLSNTYTLQVRVAPEPQMAVCKGLVADRRRKLKSGQSVLGLRCCRASYGLLCKELYDKNNPSHMGRAVQRDPSDPSQVFVTNCIDWLVKKGAPVATDRPIIHPFQRKIKPGDPRKVFPSKVVFSDLDRDALPDHLETGVEQLCMIEADLSKADEGKFIAKNKKFWQSGASYLLVQYEVRVIIGPADLTFELWFQNQKMTKEKPITVEWTTSSEALPDVQEAPSRFDDDSQRVKKKQSRSRLAFRSRGRDS